ncbi:MAG: helix-turn-helix domain-containing protein [Proteobacteria bacterium]|nr:helix-turn-helix domain-containing protein [Pseudomonadota bacterium]NIS68752.1 helix-turn-helix domain-containing protein [Pseudomonadota bacterium]
MKHDRYLINSVLRAARILESFSFEKSTYTNSELSKKLHLNKSTVTRLLCSLEKAGFLQRNNKTAEYRLTHRLFRIGSIYINQIGLHSEAMPLLSELASSCKETVHLAVLNEFEVFYLDKVESSQSIGMMSRIGNKSPSYCTGVGKVMLAHLSENDLEKFFCSIELKGHTPNTITDPAKLRLHLHKIREMGYAVDNAEHETEVKCVAAPVRDRAESVIAGISISGPVFRMTQERIKKELIPAVKETANMISIRLGYVRSEF